MDIAFRNQCDEMMDIFEDVYPKTKSKRETNHFKPSASIRVQQQDNDDEKEHVQNITDSTFLEKAQLYKSKIQINQVKGMLEFEGKTSQFKNGPNIMNQPHSATKSKRSFIGEPQMIRLKNQKNGSALQNSLGPSQGNVLSQPHNRGIISGRLREIEDSRSTTTDNSAVQTRSDYIVLKELGVGAFGEVYHVRHKITGEEFAMKKLSKNKMERQNMIKYARTERNILSIMNHPFIVKLDCAFQDHQNLYLILEYCKNGNLAELIDELFTIPETMAKIYAAEIVLALGCLHENDIVYRDLKPENVVIDDEGHVKLTDFGLSKEGVQEPLEAKSFCGSLAYLAPEMIKQTGHGKSVDWYVLGILIYEFLLGVPPFFEPKKEGEYIDEKKEKEELFDRIAHEEPEFMEAISPESEDLIKKLLVKDPMKRLGAKGRDAEELKEHPWFKTVDWDKVINREYRLLGSKFFNEIQQESPKVANRSEPVPPQMME